MSGHIISRCQLASCGQTQSSQTIFALCQELEEKVDTLQLMDIPELE